MAMKENEEEPMDKVIAKAINYSFTNYSSHSNMSFRHQIGPA